MARDWGMGLRGDHEHSLMQIEVSRDEDAVGINPGRNEGTNPVLRYAAIKLTDHESPPQMKILHSLR